VAKRSSPSHFCAAPVSAGSTSVAHEGAAVAREEVEQARAADVGIGVRSPPSRRPAGFR
jgi:hypothetical protein